MNHEPLGIEAVSGCELQGIVDLLYISLGLCISRP